MTEKEHTTKSTNTSVRQIVGSAFILATSSVGPAFLTQTAQFTGEYRESFGFAILIAVAISWIVQLNFSRMIGVTGMRGQEIANEVRPGLGNVLGVVVAAGGLFFNIGNISGVALGLTAITGWSIEITAAISGILGILVFSSKHMDTIMDWSATIMGSIIIILLMVIAIASNPPPSLVIKGTVSPDTIPVFAILTIIGGTVGGFIPFSGAHRLVDANITGEDNLPKINQSINLGMIVSAAVRVLMFVATLGVLVRGFTLDPQNPASTPFIAMFGEVGNLLFGIVFACAALTSVIGNSFTSVSFLKHFDTVKKHETTWIIVFIVLSTALAILVGQPAFLLVLAGTVNAFILPFSLSIILIASNKSEIVGKYKHSKLVTVLGWICVAVTGIFAVLTLISNIA